MFKPFLVVFLLFFVSGCTIDGATHGKNLNDYNGTEKVGVVFDVSHNIDLYVYPETRGCIDSGSDQRGYVNGAIFFRNTKLTNKKIGSPEFLGMPILRREFWLSSKDKIVIVEYSYDNFFSKPLYITSFQPQPGKFYYIFMNANKNLGGPIMIKEIVSNAKGLSSLVSVDTIDETHQLSFCQ